MKVHWYVKENAPTGKEGLKKRPWLVRARGVGSGV